MAGKAGRSGRPKAPERRAFQVRLEADEAEALDALVERRRAEAAESGASVSASGVLRAIARAALIEEGLLVTPQKGKVKR
jgi:hypothetical protein